VNTWAKHVPIAEVRCGQLRKGNRCRNLLGTLYRVSDYEFVEPIATAEGMTTRVTAGALGLVFDGIRGDRQSGIGGREWPLNEWCTQVFSGCERHGSCAIPREVVEAWAAAGDTWPARPSSVLFPE
jgi:hypothetical protein